MNRFFTNQPLTSATTTQLASAIQQHAIKVLRMQVGDQLELVSEAGHVFLSTIVEPSPLTVAVGKEITQPVELPVAVHLVCGVPKGDKAELIVQKATELGAASITFVNTQWATARWRAERIDKKLTRLQGIAQGAAEQSHRNVIPEIDFAQNLEYVATTASSEAKLIAYEESAKAGEVAQLVTTLAEKPASLTVVFGPEGGIAPEEVAALTAQGFVTAGLGPRILRTETAPLYLLSAVSTLTELGGNYA
ncbi:16S rRNA (uracil(1498)-N(3))-methyltransferase [Lacticaseibacillus brantae]|uniref:Ribosomal RNA small subunit methyltransferase E n=1 Tax=Lacticaseibacillus brantae DSM 23927 TaxID=1423727 RepID=A0A0R2AZK6_9LACO|nr:16S rRNA (uracil(1498)-N(3))-methyltransferase [Lacticaseibacillus brantae]KRM72717.1 hypothetical protein FC34_GL000427 [Lacticaseibacillus brantae DSM 23927]